MRADPSPFHRGDPGVKCIIYSLGPYVNKAELVRNLMAGGYDGLFVDSLGTAPIDSNYVLTKAINPNTDNPYTGGEWLAAEVKMVQAAREALPKGKLLFMNGLGPGTRYSREPEASSPRALLAQFDGAMSESIWRTARAPLDEWPSVESWMLDIRMVRDVDRRGLYGFWWTKCGSVVGEKPKDEETHQNLVPRWRRFALASYLLAAGPKSYFNFLAGDLKLNDAAQYYPEYDAPLGVANGPMRELGKRVYYRSFSGGLVIVNPAGSAAKAGSYERRSPFRRTPAGFSWGGPPGPRGTASSRASSARQVARTPSKVVSSTKIETVPGGFT
jgi:hypothetical protein